MSERKNTLGQGGRAAGSVEADILSALADFTDALKAGQVKRRLTCKQVKLNLEPTQYDSKLVVKTRRALNVSQVLFARFLGVSPKTVRAWEQGACSPSPMACRFMDEIRRAPDFWAGRLQELTTSTS